MKNNGLFSRERIQAAYPSLTSPLTLPAITPGLPPDLYSPRGHSAAEVRGWIKAVCTRLDVTPTQLARKAELAPSTLNRFLAGTGPNQNVSARTIDALVSAAAMIFWDVQTKELATGEQGR